MKRSLILFLTFCISGMFVLAFSQSEKPIDLFVRDWTPLNWPDIDPCKVEFASDWQSEGFCSMKLSNLETTASWSGCVVINENPQEVTEMKVAIYNACESTYQLRFEIFNTSGQQTKVAAMNLEPLEQIDNFTIQVNDDISRIMVIQDYAEGESVLTYIDNIRFNIGGQEIVWEGFEDAFQWKAIDDAATGESGQYSTSMYSGNPGYGSSSSIIMEWNSAVNSSIKAELKTDILNENLSGYSKLLVDVYRPASTSSDIKIKGWLWSTVSSSDAGDGGVSVEIADQWTTISLPIENPVTTITQIALIVDSTNKTGCEAGKLYFDNLRVVDDNIYAQFPLISPLPEVDHIIQDYEDDDASLSINRFYGVAGVGQSSIETSPGVYENTASISQALSPFSCTGDQSVVLNYNVSQEGSYVYYYNRLSLNSEKNKFVVYMKSDSTDFGSVKLEFKDKDNRPGNFSGAKIYLTHVTSEWQQWIVDINNDLTAFDAGFDPDNITEVTLVLDNEHVRCDTGNLYVDDMTFIDDSELLTTYRGHSIPLDVSSLSNMHTLKDFEGIDTILTFNKFYGQSGTGQSSYYDDALEELINTAYLSQSLTEGYQGKGVELDYDVSESGSFVYYTHKLNYNTKKNKISLRMRAASEAENPGTVVLQFKDIFNSGDIYWSGMNCLLHGITTEWQQWVIDIDTVSGFICSEAGYVGIDTAHIGEMTIVVDHANAVDKTGKILIDDISFSDLSDEFTPYDGFSPAPDTLYTLSGDNMDSVLLWNAYYSSNSLLQLQSFPGINDDGIIYHYNLGESGWITMQAGASFDPRVTPLSFYVKAPGEGQLEVKFVDTEQNIYRKDIEFSGSNGFTIKGWTHITLYLSDVSSPGDISGFSGLASIELGFTGGTTGELWFDEIGPGLSTTPSLYSPMLDPDSTLSGIGPDQRRALSMTDVDPLVLEYLRQLQDPVTGLIRSSDGENMAQTFNNAMVAMAFIIEKDTSSAIPILDFYQEHALNVNNEDSTKQEFFVRGEPRGFYQQVYIETLTDTTFRNDRWMGDMAWLLCAYKLFEREYDNRYSYISNLLYDFLTSLYIAPGDPLNQYSTGGYLLKGWRHGDSYSPENPYGWDDNQKEEVYGLGLTGHPEGNIDAWAALKMCGANSAMLDNIEAWIDYELTVVTENKDLSLDLYTWRALAMGADDPAMVNLLNIPEYDLRYRKTVSFNDRQVTGMYSTHDPLVSNIWTDGFGHMICAYLSYGDRQRGYYYSNELDKLIIPNVVNGVLIHTLPYAANRSGEYSGYNPNKGFSSSSAWYVFAKNSFNPFSTYSIYIDVPYSKTESTNYSDAACAKMILDFEGENSYSQSMLHDLGTGMNLTSGLDYFDPTGMKNILNSMEVVENYNYGQLSKYNLSYAFNDLCFWMSYNIPNVPKQNMPSTVPVGGTFNDWIVVNGFHSSVNPHSNQDYTVYGFYVKDPRVNGIGQDMYIQSCVFGNEYFLPIDPSMPGVWDNKYVTVDEPPVNTNTLTIQPSRAALHAPVSNELRFAAAEQGLKNYQLMNARSVSAAMNGAEYGNIYFVDLEGTADDYYIVCFEKDSGVIASVTIDATDGALREVTFLDNPDTAYYSRVPGTMLKSVRNPGNPFYPDASTVELVYGIGGSAVSTEVPEKEMSDYKQNTFNIMPNPASDHLEVEYSLPVSDLVDIRIIDLSGSTVKIVCSGKQEAGIYRYAIDVQDLNEGVYLCRFITSAHVSVKKFVVSR